MSIFEFKKTMFTASMMMAIGITYSCVNNSQKHKEIEMSSSESDKYSDFVDKAADAPITETNLCEGFRFDMSKKQFNKQIAKFKKQDRDFVLFKIDGVSYTATLKGNYNDDKLYNMEISIYSIGEGDFTPLSNTDLEKLLHYYKSKYDKEYSYLYINGPLVLGPTHMWRKNNIIIKISVLYAGSDINSVTIEYENYPIISAISKANSKELIEKIRKRAEAKARGGDVDVFNSSYDGSVSQVKDYLKKTLKDPKSYESIEWSKVKEETNGYSVYHKYRAKNSFGGYVIEAKIFHLDFGGNVIKVDNVQQ